MANHTPVLIVGAGPTGLLMACELARRGVDFRIIDQKPERTLTANAVGIQTLTLEMLDNIGILHQFLRLGHECKALHFHENGKDLVRIPLDNIDSCFRFALSLPQSETERLLIEHLEEFKKEVERPLELIELTQQDQGLLCTLKNQSEQPESLHCDWLIACDGAHSKVRELCQIPFPGEDLPEQFMVANAQMSSFLSNNEVHCFLNKGSILIAIPFGSHSYRVGANLQQSPRKFLVEKEIKELIQERSYGDYDVNSVSWISPFWIHDKIVTQLRYGPIFLAGDAAHIHSPMGAQGMNTGLQDAYNLAWKLALVIQGQAKPELLDSYQQERYPLVAGIVKQSERLTKLITLENPLLRQLRKLLFKYLNKHPRLSKKISMRLTQLGLRYKKSPIIQYESKLGRRSPRAGERIPDVFINQSTRLHTYLRTPQHKALLFAGPASSMMAIQELKTLSQWLQTHYPETMQVFVISNKKLDGTQGFIPDEQGIIHRHFQIKSPAIYLIRPDNYIAYCSTQLDPLPLKNLLDSYLT